MLLKIIDILSKFAIPFMIVGIISFGMSKRIRVYESFIEGAKDGFTTAIRIIPSFVAMLVAIGVFRSLEPWTYLLKPLAPYLKYLTYLE